MKRWTRSQVRSVVGLAALIVSSVCGAVTPQLGMLPPEYKPVVMFVSILGAIAGGLLTALNQSLHAGHISVPIEKAEAMGLVDEAKG